MTKIIDKYNQLDADIKELIEEIKSQEDSLIKDLMIAQLKSMESYASLLAIRIGLSPKNDVSND